MPELFYLLEWGQLFSRETFLGGNCPAGGGFLGGNCLGVIILGAVIRRAGFCGGNCPRTVYNNLNLGNIVSSIIESLYKLF